jgi:hypothetical protein
MTSENPFVDELETGFSGSCPPLATSHALAN